MICIFCDGFVNLPANNTEHAQCIECGREFVPKTDHGFFSYSARAYVPADVPSEVQHDSIEEGDWDAYLERMKKADAK